MDYTCIISIVTVFLKIFGVNGQGFGTQFSPFGQQAFGGNVFVPQNFPRPIQQTIDLEQQGTFSISPPDGSAGVQLLETTVTEGGRVILREGGQQSAQGGQIGFQGQNFGNIPQPGQRAIIGQFPGGGIQPPNVQIIQTGGGFGNPFPGLQLPSATLMPPVAIPGTQNTQTGGTNIIGGNLQEALPTSVPNTQVNIAAGQTIGNIQQNQAFLQNNVQGTQQFTTGGFQVNQQFGVGGIQTANNQDAMANAVNSITGSDTFGERFNLIDPTTNNDVGDISNTNVQTQQNQQFQVNQNVQQAQNNAIFRQQQNQFQNQGQFLNAQSNQVTAFQTGAIQVGQFPGTNQQQNVQLGVFNPATQPQFIGSQGQQFGNIPRSAFETSNDIQASSNTNSNISLAHPRDPSVGVFMTDIFTNTLPQHATSVFTQFGLAGFKDVFPDDVRPTPNGVRPSSMPTLAPGITFTTMTPASTTTAPQYSCQHR